jgi:hypothetical protein
MLPGDVSLLIHNVDLGKVEVAFALPLVEPALPRKRGFLRLGERGGGMAVQSWALRPRAALRPA